MMNPFHQFGPYGSSGGDGTPWTIRLGDREFRLVAQPPSTVESKSREHRSQLQTYESTKLDEFKYKPLPKSKKRVRLLELQSGTTYGAEIYCTLIEVDYDNEFHIPTSIAFSDKKNGIKESATADPRNNTTAKRTTTEEGRSRKGKKSKRWGSKKGGRGDPEDKEAKERKEKEEKERDAKELKERAERLDTVLAHETSYEALSWHWGTGPEEYAVIITQDNKQYKKRVRKELALALKYLRLPDKTRTLWVDSICIDQSNDNERSQQVQMMSRIYTRADQVSIWLGEDTDESKLAIDFINKEIMHLNNFDRLCSDKLYSDKWRALMGLMQREWFSRRWVVQEIALASKARLYCGPDSISWKALAVAVELFVEVETATHRLSEIMKKDEKFLHVPGWFDHVSELGASLLVQATGRVFRAQRTPLHENSPDDPEKALELRRQAILRESTIDPLDRRSLLSLEYLVSTLFIFKASEPRDTVYSLLGIARDATPFARSSFQDGDPSLLVLSVMKEFLEEKPFVVDYARPYSDVCRDYVEFTIRRKFKLDPVQALDVLCRPWALDPPTGKSICPANKSSKEDRAKRPRVLLPKLPKDKKWTMRKYKAEPEKTGEETPELGSSPHDSEGNSTGRYPENTPELRTKDQETPEELGSNTGIPKPPSIAGSESNTAETTSEPGMDMGDPTQDPPHDPPPPEGETPRHAAIPKATAQSERTPDPTSPKEKELKPADPNRYSLRRRYRPDGQGADVDKGVETAEIVKAPDLEEYWRDINGLEEKTDFESEYTNWRPHPPGWEDVLWYFPEEESSKDSDTESDSKASPKKNETDLDHLPSWVALASHAPFALYPHTGMGFKAGRSNADPLVGQPQDGHRNYSAAQTNPADLDEHTFKFRKRLKCGHYSLYVRGFQIDTVETVLDASQSGNIPKSWLDLGGWNPGDGNTYKDDPPDHFWRTLVADRGRDNRNPPYYYATACKESVQRGGIASGSVNTSDLINNHRNSIVAEFCRRVQAVIWSRHLFMTKNGKLGLARSVQKGDQVCILYGCTVPVIVREITKGGSDDLAAAASTSVSQAYLNPSSGQSQKASERKTAGEIIKDEDFDDAIESLRSVIRNLEAKLERKARYRHRIEKDKEAREKAVDEHETRKKRGEKVKDLDLGPTYQDDIREAITKATDEAKSQLLREWGFAADKDDSEADSSDDGAKSSVTKSRRGSGSIKSRPGLPKSPTYPRVFRTRPSADAVQSALQRAATLASSSGIPRSDDVEPGTTPAANNPLDTLIEIFGPSADTEDDRIKNNKIVLLAKRSGTSKQPIKRYTETPIQRKEVYYEFKGDAYVHGMMDGEALRDKVYQKLPDIVFELR